MSTEPAPIEARTGLPPFRPAEMPEPPRPKGLGWIPVVGPGVILLGAAIGSGEFLLGPAVIVKHGPSILWIAAIAVVLQTLFNQEVMRYTLATGEPVFSGFMCTKPHATFWAFFYAGLYLLQFGWPAWAGTAAGAAFFVGNGRLPGAEDAGNVYLLGVAGFLVCLGILLVGKRIERTLEILNWVMVATIIAVLIVLALVFTPPSVWARTVVGFTGFDLTQGRFTLLPSNVDFFLLGAFAAFTGAGGIANMTLSNWARDKGYGMSGNAGYIASAIGGKKVELAHSGFRFSPTPEGMDRWRGWWRITNMDQWGIFLVGAVLGMALPAMLYQAFIPEGTDIRGLGAAAALAEAMGAASGRWLSVVVAMIGFWLLFKTQLDLMEGMTRSITDILWTGSKRIRAWRGGDVRLVYYVVLGIGVTWGVVALKLAQPIVLLQLAANIGGAIFVFGSFHLLYINCKYLPVEVRPSMLRRVGLVGFAAFYGVFVFLWLRAAL